MDHPSTDHLIIGISPFNPHFSFNWLTNALHWGATHFHTVDILHPGTAAASLLTATGTPAGRALRKARQQCNKDLRNVMAASHKTGINLGKKKPILISDHLGDEQYLLLRERAVLEYKNNPEFQAICQKMSAKAALSRLQAKGSTASPDITKAVTYVFDEIPAYTHSAKIFNYPSTTLSYPSPWPVGDFIESHPTSLKRDPNSHFSVLDFPMEETHV